MTKRQNAMNTRLNNIEMALMNRNLSDTERGKLRQAQKDLMTEIRATEK